MPRSSNIHLLALGLALSAFFSTTAVAQGTGTAAANTAQGKIGIVNIQEAIFATNEGKKEADALQTKFAPKQAELKNLNDEVDGLKKQLQTQSDKLNEDERNNRVRTIETKQKSLQRSYDDAQSEFQQAEQEVYGRLAQKMSSVLDKFAKDNGYLVVLDVSNPQTPVLWANQGTNITKDLVDAYNTGAPAAAPAPKPAATGAAARPAGTAAHTPAAPATTPKKP
ncbi:MAG TPA: OmpH family outer membrane protein [Candidatus Angelobacter sp.]|nr:OmpH family outer membrane protein [Candidatus Angelobacter sp.]